MTWGVSRKAREVCQEETDGMRRGRKRLRLPALLHAMASSLVWSSGAVGDELPMNIDSSPVYRTGNGIAGTG